jgi:hypothetical protein
MFCLGFDATRLRICNTTSPFRQQAQIGVTLKPVPLPIATISEQEMTENTSLPMLPKLHYS